MKKLVLLTLALFSSHHLGFGLLEAQAQPSLKFSREIKINFGRVSNLMLVSFAINNFNNPTYQPSLYLQDPIEDPYCASDPQCMSGQMVYATLQFSRAILTPSYQAVIPAGTPFSITQFGKASDFPSGKEWRELTIQPTGPGFPAEIRSITFSFAASVESSGSAVQWLERFLGDLTLSE